MKDIYGVPLEVGQKVAACVQFGRSGYELVRATVLRFTPTMVVVDITSASRWYNGERRISPYKLAVVN